MAAARVVARLLDLRSALLLNSSLPSLSDGRHDVTGRPQAEGLRLRERPRRRLVPRPDGLERGRGAPVGGACEALLLTPKARIVAPLVVWRRGADDFLLLTEPGAGERLARELLRARFAAKCSIGPRSTSSVVLGAIGARVDSTRPRWFDATTTGYRRWS